MEFRELLARVNFLATMHPEIMGEQVSVSVNGENMLIEKLVKQTEGPDEGGIVISLMDDG